MNSVHFTRMRAGGPTMEHWTVHSARQTEVFYIVMHVPPLRAGSQYPGLTSWARLLRAFGGGFLNTAGFSTSWQGDVAVLRLYVRIFHISQNLAEIRLGFLRSGFFISSGRKGWSARGFHRYFSGARARTGGRNARTLCLPEQRALDPNHNGAHRPGDGR